MTAGRCAGSREPGSTQICEAGCFGPPDAHSVLQISSQGWARWVCPRWPRFHLPVVGSAQGGLCTQRGVARPSCRPCPLACASRSRSYAGFPRPLGVHARPLWGRAGGEKGQGCPGWDSCRPGPGPSREGQGLGPLPVLCLEPLPRER